MVSSTAPMTSRARNTLFVSADMSPFSTAKGRAGSDTGKGGKPGNRTNDCTKIPVMAIIATCSGRAAAARQPGGGGILLLVCPRKDDPELFEQSQEGAQK